MSCTEETLLHFAVLDRVILGPLARPVILELVEVPAGSTLACKYTIRCYRVDTGMTPAGGTWPLAAQEERHVPYVRQRVRMRWKEASAGGELPADVFEEVSA